MFKQYKVYILIICQIFCIKVSYAQLNASFKLSKDAGCVSTMAGIQFVNTTTGASGSATYKWDFGDGNTPSTIPDTVYHSYVYGGSFTVTLTVTDGANTSVYTHVITVYDNPTADFTFSSSNGCVPITVSFTQKANANGGTITSYAWDFDDGQGSALTNPTHTYTYGKVPSVKLVVTNSNNCVGSITKTGIIAYPYPVPSFSSTDTILCSAGSTAGFINTTDYDTSNFGSITYLWDFGDGGTSTLANPTHKYTSKGTFNVKLTAVNSMGCQADTIATGYIRVANFSTNFKTDTVLCTNTIDVITDISGTKATIRNWYIDNGFASTDSSFNYVFPTTGYHTIRLMNQYNNCIDSLSKIVLVETALAMDSFKIVNNNSACGSANVQLIDTGNYVNCKRAWLVVPPSGNSNATTYTTATVNYPATELGTYGATLTITDTVSGCTNFITDSFTVAEPLVTIVHVDTPSTCVPFAMTFAAKVSPPGITITDYQWDFGDDPLYTLYPSATPTHTYDSVGSFTAQLYYTTTNGCTGSVSDATPVVSYNKPQSLFKVSQFEICGNNALYFSDTSLGKPTQWYWNFGDSSLTQPNFYSIQQNPSHKYQDSGFYTITLIAKNPSCADTTVKTSYVHILPDLPNGTVLEDCIDRSKATLLNISKYDLDSLVWDLGNGITKKITPPSTPLYSYSYSATGSYLTQLIGYKAVTPLIDPTLTSCVVKDTIPVNVLLKQKPTLILLNTTCSSKGADFKISGLEHNPSVPSGGNSYSIVKFQFKDDNTTFSGSTNFNLSNANFDTTFTGTLINGFSGHDSIRVIIQQLDSLHCQDTTNYIAIDSILVADFMADTLSCKLSPVSFVDKSTPRKGIPITSWTWDFGDGVTATMTNTSKGGDTVHTYPGISYYYPQLTVVDALGCTAQTAPSSKIVLVDGPKADFTFSPTTGIIPYTTVSFTNTSLGDLVGYTIDYTWKSTQWGTHIGSSISNPTPVTSYIYGNTVPDTVTLIASSSFTACPNDTITKIIPIKTITVAFTDSLHYSGTSNCPPLQVIFKNHTINAKSLMWSFGDGSFSYDSLPQHIYTEAGDFSVVLYGYGDNGYVDSTSDTIHVLGPLGSIKSSSIASSCAPANYQLIAQTNALSYKWDYGDGIQSATISAATDTTNHIYITGGRFRPTLILSDGVCSYGKALDTFLLVDTLHVNISHSPSAVCDSGSIVFTPTAQSVSQLQPTYSWQFMSGGVITSTSTQTSPQFYSNVVGPSYALVHASIASTGCTYDGTDTVIVRPSYTGTIVGDSDVCYNTPVQYSVTPAPAGTTIGWLWTFNNGNTDTNEPPALQKFAGATTGYTHPINVKVTVDGCTSTINKNIWIHSQPTINISSASNYICLQDSIQLTANGGVKYLWQPPLYINNDTISTPKVSPPITTTYTVTATDQYGCSNSDSTQIQVIQPVILTATPDTFVCKNSSVQLYASGANTYLWDASSFINNVNVSNPIVTPPSSTTFKVKGYSLYNCFVDSANVYVEVKASPSVSFNSDTLQVMAGDQVTLQPIYSSDVVSYLWTPGNYLNCTTCANPVVTTTNDMKYTVQVQNQYQCAASDSVFVAVFCAAGKIYIPTAFTPNGDGKNDVFYVMGKGVKQVNHFRIFDRWGNIVFERYNCALNDATVGWNGTYNGLRANIGTYIYEVQVQCDTGTVFNYRGTVVLIR